MTLCGSSISMSISSLVASVTELVCEVKRLPLPTGNTLLTLPNSRTSSFDVQNRSRESALQPVDVSCHANFPEPAIISPRNFQRFSPFPTLTHTSHAPFYRRLMLEQMRSFRTSYLLSKVGGSIQEKKKRNVRTARRRLLEKVAEGL